MNRRRSTAATADRSRCMPSSAVPYRFGHSRRTDHAVTMPVEKHSSVRPRTELFPRAMAAATAPRCSQPSAWARHRSSFGWPPDQHVCRPAPDHCKLLVVLIAVQDPTLSLSMKRISCTSQLFSPPPLSLFIPTSPTHLSAIHPPANT